MIQEQLEDMKITLLNDLEKIGLPTDFTLDFRGYSSTYEGRYNIEKKRIKIYALEENGELRPHSELLPILIHEAIHHWQFNYQVNFVRYKGVMHNHMFKTKYAECIARAKELKLIE